jgi:putative SOS response-associated peptidase YedK
LLPEISGNASQCFQKLIHCVTYRTVQYSTSTSATGHPASDAHHAIRLLVQRANELMEPIHNRMPVILHPRDYDRWLTDYDESRPPIDLLRSYEADGIRMTPGSSGTSTTTALRC